MRLALLALAVVLLAPAAAAHLETYSEAKPLVLGPYNGLVEPYPSPAFENSAITLRAIFSRTATGAYVNDVRASVDVRYPDGSNVTRPLEPDGTGYYVSQFVVQRRGEHVARIALTDAEGTYENETTVTVYPDVGVRVAPADPALPDPLVGREYPLGVLVTDNLTRRPTDKLTDLRVRMEHWTDDHKTLLATQEVPLRPTGPGVWSAAHTFPEKGMYHLRFASSSGGFNYDDVPLLHVYASEPPPDVETRNESPLPPTLGLLALVLVALLRRR